MLIHRRLNFLGRPNLLPLLFAGLTFFASVFASAQFYSAPAIDATGGAGRAAVVPLDGGNTNPASVGELQRYDIGLDYTTGKQAQLGSHWQWGATVADGTSSTIINAAFSFHGGRQDLTDMNTSTSQQYMALALGGLMWQRLAVGVTGHRLDQQLDSGNKYTQMNFDVGLLYPVTQNFGVALVGYNLSNTSGSVPLEIRQQRAAAAGISYIFSDFLHVRLDAYDQLQNNVGHKLKWMAGIDSRVIPDFYVRLGYQLDQLANRKLYTAGLGFKGPRLSLDYTVEIQDGVAGSTHMFDLWAPL